jgi:hypothetical protein
LSAVHFANCMRHRPTPRTESKSIIFWDITPCSQLKVNRRFGGTSELAACFHAGFLIGLLLTLKMEATCSSETSVDFQRTIRRYIPEDGALHNRRRENLKSYKKEIVCRFGSNARACESWARDVKVVLIVQARHDSHPTFAPVLPTQPPQPPRTYGLH